MTLVLLSAPSGAGKTMACARAFNFARDAKFRTAGILSLPSYKHDQKKAILLQNMATEEIRPLARRAKAHETPDIGYWKMEKDTITWGNEILASPPPSDLLFLDEIGPLELIYRRGLTRWEDAIRNASYRLAVMTIRPSLLALVKKTLEDLNPLGMLLNEANRDEIPHTFLELLQKDSL